jgi:transposase
MARREELTDEQWAIIAPLIPEPPRREDGRGRPWKDSREVMNGILWVLRSGARWEDLPERFPPYQTCHRRFQQWVREGVLRGVLEALAEDLRARGDLDLSECFIDGMFVVAKKEGSEWERPSGAKVRSSWRWQTALVFLSPFTQRLLRRMKSPLSLILSSKASSTSSRSG